jgi:hypothetical protein
MISSLALRHISVLKDTFHTSCPILIHTCYKLSICCGLLAILFVGGFLVIVAKHMVEDYQKDDQGPHSSAVRVQFVFHWIY